MRILFAHDHRFFRDSAGRHYSSGSFPASLWERYLEHFDEICVVAREGGVAIPGSHLTPSDRDDVRFELLPSLSSFQQLLFRSSEFDVRMGSAVASADAVVARLPSEMGLLAVRHARRLGKPYAIELVGCTWDAMLSHGAITARMYGPLAYLRTRIAITNAPFVLYVTSSWLQGRYPTKGCSQNASNVELVAMGHAAAQRRRARLAGLARGRKPTIGTIGTLWAKYKGIQTALAALSRLRREGLELTYRILGPGPPDPWRRLADEFGIADLVRFDGTQSAGEQVSDWLDQIDIYLQPSFTEGLPRGMIEAMSRGACCIGSTRGGIPELLPPERLHRAGDVGDLAEKIRRFASDPAAIAKASRADREKSAEFDRQALKRRRHAFYKRLWAEAGSRRPA